MKRVLFLIIPFIFSACALTPKDTTFHKVRVFFNDPESGQSPEGMILDAIARARVSIDLAIYEFSRQSIADALTNARARGVALRVVGDEGHSRNSGFETLRKAGIPIRFGNRERSMHDKYMIVDHKRVLTGSANLSDTAMANNDENMLVIDSPAVADYYLRDFATMFSGGFFGTNKTGRLFRDFDKNTFLLTNADHLVSVISVYFSSYQEHATDEVIRDAIDRATSSVRFAIFAMTDPEIANSLISAARRGLTVEGLFDRDWQEGNVYALTDRFLDAAMDIPTLKIRLDGNEHYAEGSHLSGAKCHDKWMLIDAGDEDGAVLTGSYNYTRSSAMGNDENFVLVRDRTVTRDYLAQYRRLFARGYNPITDAGGECAAFHDVVVSEIQWAGSMDIQGHYFKYDQFVELSNRSRRALNISGWQLVGTRHGGRGLMTILPRGTILGAGGILLIADSTNMSLDAKDAFVDPFLSLKDRNTPGVYVELRDSAYHVIDRAGDPLSLPFAGVQGNIRASMIRIADDGEAPASWRDCEAAGRYLRARFKMTTFATPDE